MAQTKIEWATHSWNPVTGCSPVSEGCNNCYAKRMANRLKGRCGYDADNPFNVTPHPERLGEPLRTMVDKANNLAGHDDYEKPWKVGKKAAGRHLDGRVWGEVPCGVCD